ncbi:MAG: MFS transporter, partial [Natronospirillum sp.]
MHEEALIGWRLTALAFCGFIIVTTEFSVVALVPMMANGMNITVTKAGSLMGWFAIAAAVVGPFVTVACGRLDRWRFIIGATILFVIGNLAIALFASYSVAIWVRVIQGCLLPAIIANVMVSAKQSVAPSRSGWAITRANTGVAVATVVGIPALSWISNIS